MMRGEGWMIKNEKIGEMVEEMMRGEGKIMRWKWNQGIWLLELKRKAGKRNNQENLKSE